MLRPKHLQFVLKISKLCNLRCSYCYEFPELGNKARMPLDKLGRLFANVRAFSQEKSYNVEFIWHGGEPLLVKPSYYKAIKVLQDEAFGGSVKVSNVVQTNLTVLSDEHYEFLKSETFFRGLGISFDVYGDQRVDIKGRLRTDTVLANMQRLIDGQIEFGAISVLARNTLPHAKDIFHFYEQLRIQHRFLPFYRGALEEQISHHSLTFDEIVTTLQSIFDEWLASEHATPVEPLAQYTDHAIAYLRAGETYRYDKEEGEAVFLVNPDGGTWGTAEAYDPSRCYGNVFEEGLDAVLASSGRRRCIEESRARMDMHCRGCPYFGFCPGRYVGDASPAEASMMEQSGCPARAMISHILARLEETGLTQKVMDAVDREAVVNPALSIDL